MSFNNPQARIEVSEIQERIDELNEQIDNLIESDEATELVTLRELMESIDGEETLIHVHAWKRYVIDEWQQVVEDSNLPEFLKNNIDWEGAADDQSSEHTTVDFDGENYYLV
jgi:hypothetical protein